MEKSRYLGKFAALDKEAPHSYELIGDYLLVEKIKDEEFAKKVVTDDGRTVSLTISQSARQRQVDSFESGRPMWLRVLAVGKGYFKEVTDDESGKIVEETVPLSTMPGDLVLVSSISVKFFSVFGELEGYEADTIGLTQEGSVQLRFRGEAGYQAAFSVLNNSA